MKNVTIQELSELLKKYDGYRIIYHVRPDGDCIGSAYALALALKKKKKKCEVTGEYPVTNSYKYLVNCFKNDKVEHPINIAVDSAAPDRLGIYQNESFTFCIDHHNGNSVKAEYKYVEIDCGACSEIILKLIKAMGTEITKEMANLMYLALVTDTMSFRTYDVSKQSFETAAELAGYGADICEIGRKHMFLKTPERVKIENTLKNSFHFTCNNRMLTGIITLQDLDDANILVCTDLDEIFEPGWGQILRDNWTEQCTMCHYLYAWSHMEDGSPGRVFWYDKIHKNSGLWQWKFPVHEALSHPIYGHNHLASNQYCRMPNDFIMLHHYPVEKSSRSNYLPLLELRARENPDDFYGLVYLAHEYKYQQKPQECIEFVYGTVFPAIVKGKDDMNCKTDLYMFLGDCYNMLNQPEEAIASYKAGIEMDPTFRDNYTRLGKLYYNQGRYLDTIEIINKGMLKSRRQYSWLESDATWSWEMWDLLCLAYWEIQAIDMSYHCALIAYSLDPNNERLKDNYLRLQNIVKSSS